MTATILESIGVPLIDAVLLGVDRTAVAEALRRHAPDVPVRDVSRADDGTMTEVAAAAELAGPGPSEG